MSALPPVASLSSVAMPAAPVGRRGARSFAPVPAGPGVLTSAPATALAPETLHPALWLGHQLGRHTDHTLPSGFALLDAQLPGGGWPRRVLSELLLPHPGVGEIRLLSRCLASIQQAGRLVMLFDPPQALCAWALAQLDLDVTQLLVVHTRCKLVPGSDSLWALEQALKSGHVGAVVAWLPPRLRAERLRRLQLAAQAHDGPAFVLREMASQQRPTTAPLRLALRPGGADMLSLRVLKRRGPPLDTPLSLALPPVLSSAARSRMRPMRMPVPGAQDDAHLNEATFINLAS